MSYELTAVMQEESERIAGKALPTEICWLIMLKWGGMVSPSAMAVREAKKKERPLPQDASAFVVELYTMNWLSEFDDWMWKCNMLGGAVRKLKSEPLPDWVKEDIGDIPPNPLWPYVSKQARLEGMKRATSQTGACQTTPLFDLTYM